MIVRVVKMTFKPEHVEEFLNVFHTYKQYIRKSEGCEKLELLNDIHSPTIFFTYSHWNSESDLNNYRDSELFSTVWGKTKMLFEAKAEAWSLMREEI
ncbi:MAG: antibiotic biosynthesis monooxygenase family protein [Bacteroidia bacterium]